MSQNYYLLEKLAEAHRQDLLREAEHERMLAGLPKASSSSIRRLTGRLGMLLIALGMRLQQIGQQRKAVVYEP